MNKTMRRALVIAVVVVFVLFIIFQFYNTIYNPLTTEMAQYITTYDGVPITGYSIRNDQLLPDSDGGVKSYLAADGEKVAKDSVIVNLYNDSTAVTDFSRVSQIEQQLDSLKELQNFSEAGAADLSIVDAQISEAYTALLSSTADSDFAMVGELSDKLLELMNKKQIATGTASDFSARIAALESEKNTLITMGATPTATITAESSGYFVSGWDGYETVLTPECIDTLTPDALTNIKPVTTGNYMGKIVGDFTWYIAANVSFADSLQFVEGDSLTLRTNLSTVTDLPVTVYRVNKSTTSDQATVIFKCAYMNGELASVRSLPMTAILQESKGLRISNKAIRIVDDVKGVYVLAGTTAKFREVEIIYSGEEYSICSMKNELENPLELYDEVIVKGKNLYDGKNID